ncbi:hypothetical protein GE21DRAFT_5217 [Neurospora crassa]|uniref:LYR motif-containing protein Cup1-like N-terminal domain-containing protein n=1 Tax=Neurospora crassa (strain ATCC 24698 / 74-OR23-1A / CBS 708.71 / DSM 1257 / FGSC 987) TaxID=367110 RepID=Q7SBG8_NEUCR|nr:hypothetical protein NCU07588 [Neurospora crassa OR74A]EAA33732.1 hypothetical protein NCU07588 [Neurospora crassa OR74A]KHE85160.1 hypothetical protein GE21DRAFT_5217 [Neurospora crassa]|eukprot:XP_962968.1 hypothetical protein NCU07588 [Neurospora crassa OR74A]
MSRPPPLPHPTTTLHLYRHLLRESSYLPVLIRPFFDERITTRFRAHRASDPSSCPQTATRLKRAHHDLRYLRAANAGDLPRMRRILLLAFGRTGAKRRQLLAELLEPDTPSSDEELQKYINKARAIVKEGRKPDWLDNWDTEKLKAFVRSQTGGDAPPIVNRPKPEITNHQLAPERYVPKENIWGGPLNEKVRRTKLKKTYKQVAEKVLPPVPREEWELLRDLVNKKEEWEVPKRRTVGRMVWAKEDKSQEEAVLDWNWQRYATQPIWLVDRQKSRRNMLLSGQVDEDLPMGEQQPINCHRYTPRLWRRTLEQVWRMTAVMERRKDGKGWEIEWGQKKYEPPVAPSADLEFFEGAPVRAEPKKKKGKQ